MTRLWKEDIDGEKWLVNPQLLIAANPKRRKTKMARRATRRKGVMPAGLRRYWAKHRRAKSNPHKRRTRSRTRKPYTVGKARVRRYKLNPKRRRSTVRRHTYSRRRARRNPQLLGVGLPPIQEVLFVGAGLVVPPMVTSMILAQLPVSWQTSKPAYYAVKAASVILPSMLVRKFVNPRAGNLMLLGGAASFAIDLLKDSGVFASLGLTGYMSQPLMGFYPSRSGRGGLGKYPGMANGLAPVQQAKMISNTPDRLNPASRF